MPRSHARSTAASASSSATGRNSPPSGPPPRPSSVAGLGSAPSLAGDAALKRLEAGEAFSSSRIGIGGRLALTGGVDSNKILHRFRNFSNREEYLYRRPLRHRPSPAGPRVGGAARSANGAASRRRAGARPRRPPRPRDAALPAEQRLLLPHGSGDAGRLRPARRRDGRDDPLPPAPRPAARALGRPVS